MSTQVEILVNGKPVKKIAYNGRTFIEAKKGSSYSIRIKNDSSFRRKFVVTVDGINVIDGKAGGSSEIGYVLAGYSSYEVSGFRTSNEEVHPFKFNDKAKSYAAKSEETGGDVSNCGVIGVQVYSEKITLQQQITQIKEIHHHHWPNNTWTLSSTSAGQCNAPNNFTVNSQLKNDTGGMLRCANVNFMQVVSSTAAEPVEDYAFNAGTEFSKEAITDKVTDTEFEIESLLTTIEIYYDYRDGLVNLGVPVTKEVAVAMPKAFPQKFCRPPKE